MHPERIPSHSDLLQLFRRAGFRAPTPLQDRVIALVMKGRDLAVQAEEGSGGTTAIVVSLIVGTKGGETRPRALVLMPGPDGVAAFSRIWARFARVVRDAPMVLSLGETDDVRREQRRLEKGAAVVVGTVERVIDHIRRGSISFDELETILVEAPDGARPGAVPGSTLAAGASAAAVLPEDVRGDFARDAQFVFAKLPPRCQAVVFTRSPPGGQDELTALLRRPVVLTTDDMATAPAEAGEHRVVHVPDGRSPDALARVLIGRAVSPTLVLHLPRTDGQALAAGLRGKLLRAEAVPATATAARRRLVTAFTNREIDVLVLPLQQSGRVPQAELEELQPGCILYYDIPAVRPAREAGRREADRGAEGAPGPAARPGPTIIVLAAGGQEKELGRLQEAIGVTLQSGEIPGRDEVLDGAIRRIVERIRTEADPAELARLRATIRRSVPLFMRSWFTAYLLQSHLPFEPAGAVGPADKGRPPLGRQPREALREPLGRQPREALREPLGRQPIGRQPPDRQLPERQPIGRSPQGQRSPRAAAGQAGPAGAPRGERPRGEARRESPGRQQREVPRESPGRQQQARPPQAVPRPSADDSRYTQLFVSIGRNRKVFTRDLTDLFAAALQLTEAEIGDVRVFDKYSFVDIASGRAADAIARLSGTQLKGRTITVNYAKKKEEKEST